MHRHRMNSVHMTHASRDGAGMACTLLSPVRPFRPSRILNFSHLITIVLTSDLVLDFVLVSCSVFFTLGSFVPLFQFPSFCPHLITFHKLSIPSILLVFYFQPFLFCHRLVFSPPHTKFLILQPSPGLSALPSSIFSPS